MAHASALRYFLPSAICILGCGVAQTGTLAESFPAVGETNLFYSSIDHGLLFPERPELGRFAPDDSMAFTFKQETWTCGGMIQHCHEWGFVEARRDAVVRTLNSRLQRAGHPPLEDGVMRGPGVVIGIGESFDIPHRPEGSSGIVKLLVCSEALAPRDECIRFVEAQQAYAPTLPFAQPDLAWRRRHRDTRLQVGVRWSDVEERHTFRWFRELGYELVYRNGTMFWEVRRRSASAHWRGVDLWWQAEITARGSPGRTE